MAGWWRVLEEYRRLWHMAVKTKLDGTGGSSRKSSSSTIPAGPRNPHCHCHQALPGPQPWGNLWGTTGVPVATQGWSQCKQQVTGGRLGHSRKKEKCRKLPEEAGKQRREVSGCTRGGYETVSIRVSHIKVKRSSWCGQVKWICFVKRKREIRWKEECFVIWIAQSQFHSKILVTDF